LFYNKELLKAAGISSLPVTADKAMNWNEFVDLAKRLTIDATGRNATDPGFDYKNIKQYGVMFETWNGPLDCFIFNNNGEWLSSDGKEFTLDRPEAAEAIQKLSDLINVYHVAPSPLAARSLPSLSVALQTKLAAMAVGGQWINLDLGQSKVNYDIGVLPKMKRSGTVVLSGATVLFKKSSHIDEAWMLIKWLENPENALELYSSGLWMPTLKNWYTDPKLIGKWVDSNPAAHPLGFKEAIMNQFLENGIPQELYYMKGSMQIVPNVISGLDPVWTGEKTAAEALKEIKLKVQPKVSGRYDVDK
jgi:multiple sugar transport system substrate-binding protein